MTIESSSRSAVRVTTATSWYMQKMKSLTGESDEGEVSSFVGLTDGKTTTVAGFGYLLDNFICTKQLSGYPGERDNVSILSHDNYKDCKLKLMRFGQSFENMPYDASTRKCNINAYFFTKSME